jgi:hypothetical protein
VEQEGYGLLLSQMHIRGGTIEYIDHKANSSMVFEGVTNTAQAEFPAGSDLVAVESRSSIDRFTYSSGASPLVSGLALKVESNMRYHVGDDSLTVEGAALLQRIPLSITGSIRGLMSAPTLDLNIVSDSVNIADLLSIIPGEYLERAAGATGTGVARVSLDVRGTVTDSTNPDVSGEVAATNALIKYPSLPGSISDVNIVARFIRTRVKQEFTLTQFSAALGSSRVNARVGVVNFDDPAISMALEANVRLGEVKEYYPLEPGTELSGDLKANVNIDGHVSKPSAMRASGSLELRNVTATAPASKTPVRNMSGVITFNNQVVDSRKFTMTLGKSDMHMAFAVKNYLSLVSGDARGSKATADVSLTSARLFAKDIMGDEVGEASAEARLTTSPPPGGIAPSEPRQTQAGMLFPDATMHITASIGTLVLEKFELSNVRASAKIDHGIITLNTLTCDAFEGSLRTRGTLNMQNPRTPAFDLSLDVTGVSAHSLLPTFTSFGNRLFGRLSMGTTMRGTLDDTLGLVTQGLSGDGRVSLENGKLTGVKVNQSVASLLHLPDLEVIDFKDWSNTFRIADGRFLINDLRITALGAEYVVNGSQGLDGTLDYTMSVFLSGTTSSRVTVPGFGSDALALFREPDGRMKLDFAVGGTSDQPRVTLDTKSARKRAEDMAKQKVLEEARRLEEQAKKKAEDVLKGLFKKK